MALAIVVDTDKAKPREKLGELGTGRDEERQTNPPFPTAIGEANPHFDVWLLDDPIAVRTALRLPADHQIPNAVKEKDPKTTVSQLIEDSSFTAQPADVLGMIAEHVNSDRCVHKKETGFAGFAKDLQHEIGPILNEGDIEADA